MYIFLAAALLAAVCNANPVYGLKPVVGAVSVRAAGSGYRAAAHVAFDLVKKAPAVVNSTDPGMLAHIRGAQIVAERVARSSNGVIEGFGSTQAQARERLHAAIARVQADLGKELDREEHVYDSVTENGAAQSQGPAYGFPGGPDAHDPCAQ
jgi:hypothetical protein